VKALLAVALVGVGLVAGRWVAAEEGVDRLTLAETTLETKLSRLAFDPKSKKAAGAADDLKEVIDLYNAPDAARSVGGSALWRFYMDRASGPEGELRLRVLEVQQNQRIIELLEQMAKPRP
jgi:hypothetical protein